MKYCHVILREYKERAIVCVRVHVCVCSGHLRWKLKRGAWAKSTDAASVCACNLVCVCLCRKRSSCCVWWSPTVLRWVVVRVTMCFAQRKAVAWVASHLCFLNVWSHQPALTKLTHSEVRASLAPGCAGLTYGLPGLLNVAWCLAASCIVH